LKPTLLITTIIILLPSSYQLPQLALPVGSFYITLIEALIFALVLIWFLNVIFFGSIRRGTSPFTGYVISVFLLYAAYIIWSLFKRDAIMVLGDFRQYMPLLLYFPLRHALCDENRMEKLRDMLYVALFVVAVYTVVIFSLFKPALLAYAEKARTGFSGERIFIDNGIFLFFAYLGSITAAFFSISTSLPRKLYYALLILMNILALLILQVRTFWIMAALIFVLSVFAMKGVANKFKYVMVGLISISLCVLLVFLFVQATDYQSKTLDSIRERLASFSDLGQVGSTTISEQETVGSVETRIATAEYAMKTYIAPNWLFGLGFGSQTPMVNKLGAQGIMKFQIDNGYLTLLLKFGLFGLLFYVIFTLKIIAELTRIIFHPATRDTDIWLAKSFLYAIIAMAAGSFFTSIFIREQVCVVSFVIMLCEITLIKQRLNGYETARVMQTMKQLA